MKLRKRISEIFFITSIIFLVFSLVFYVSYKNDIQYLKSIVLSQISIENSPKIFESINHWIYRNKGFKKNQSYYFVKSLGPTPIQILEQGGDCTDKSILLVAMLESIGIDSTLVMLFDEDNLDSTHTVVEVRSGEFRAAADPVYDLVFPNPSGGYYGIENLRKNPALLLNRLDNLIDIRGTSDKIIYYRRDNETYRFASTINWKKNNLLKITASILKKMGIEAVEIRRPHFMDDPKLLISTTLMCFSIFFVICGFVLRMMNRNNN